MRGSAGSVAVLYVYMHSSFGVICLVLAISNFGVSLMFFTWSALPVNLIFDDRVYGEMPGKIVGMVALFFLYGCEYSHIVISFNRLLNVAFPLKAPQWFRRKLTTVLVVFILILSFLEITPYFMQQNECYFTYGFETSLWNFADTDCGRFCS
ncbi:hypothetical protein PENTCL1PPCAC_8247 [Pristionchus entomophagus]|uniref:G-protein coupled receptors family 1 profile domain-containing protein n=1 Tax=Pristionchus entomophagus TaxID=358040 RepID=A0AAV5SSM9_9BILA|nr:hypothetical protein PENTCL1PPCAC_8247 [Pristionchus entomophagus]